MTSVTKISLGAAALAMAGATVVAPGVAQAADDANCLFNSTAPECVATPTALAAAAVGDTPTNPLVQNDFVWIQLNGINDAFANDADTQVVWTFKALSVAPFLAPIFALPSNQANQSCFIGITTTLGGPYAEPGEYVHSYNRKGCNLGWTTA
jgi:hypothetical protein